MAGEKGPWSRFWNFVFDYAAIHSRAYRTLELDLGIPELKRELEETTSKLEASNSYLEESRLSEENMRGLATHERALRNLAEGSLEKAQIELTEARNRIACSIPLQAVFNMLGLSQSAALFVNPDDYILFANEEAVTQIQRRCGRKKAGLVEGRSLWEITSPEFMKIFKRDLETRRTFKIGYGHFINWYVGIARDDEGQLHGYSITHERGLVKKILSLFLPEREATRRLIAKEGLLIPGKWPESTGAETY